jgi:hypothetical protein
VSVVVAFVRHEKITTAATIHDGIAPFSTSLVENESFCYISFSSLLPCRYDKQMSTSNVRF